MADSLVVRDVSDVAHQPQPFFGAGISFAVVDWTVSWFGISSLVIGSAASDFARIDHPGFASGASGMAWSSLVDGALVLTMPDTWTVGTLANCV